MNAATRLTAAIAIALGCFAFLFLLLYVLERV